MDDWKVSLQTLAVEAGAWDHLPAEMQDEIARGRWWLCAAIDCATNCIVGMRLAPEATSENAIAVLHMVVSHKKAYADAVGALSPWSMRATPESVATDAGSVYTSGEFKGAVFALGSSPITPPAGLAAMRARIERFFGTARTQLTSRFAGRRSPLRADSATLRRKRSREACASNASPRRWCGMWSTFTTTPDTAKPLAANAKERFATAVIRYGTRLGA